MLRDAKYFIGLLNFYCKLLLQTLTRKLWKQNTHLCNFALKNFALYYIYSVPGEYLETNKLN